MGSDGTNSPSRATKSAECAWHHAGDSDPRDPCHAWRCLLVSCIERACALSTKLCVFRPPRDARLVDPRHDRVPGWGRGVGWFARLEPAQTDRIHRQTTASSGRFARLEMAV